jgi:hypothetical protein
MNIFGEDGPNYVGNQNLGQDQDMREIEMKK